MVNYYAIDDDNGNQLTTGLSVHVARRTAQRMADERNRSVYLYAIGGDDDDTDSVEITPSKSKQKARSKQRGSATLGTVVTLGALGVVGLLLGRKRS